MFSDLPETHSDFRFISRRIRDAITGLMIIVAFIGIAALTAILLRILYLLF